MSINVQALPLPRNHSYSSSLTFGRRQQYKLGVTIKELDTILNTQAVHYDLNPTGPYENLSPGDKKALKYLIIAAKALDTVFLKQDNEYNRQLLKTLKKWVREGNEHAKKALTLFQIFNGVEGQSGLDQAPISLFENIHHQDGRNLFPRNTTVDEMAEYLIKHIEEAPLLLGNDHLVKRRGNGFIAVPYHIEFKKEYGQAARALFKAAELTTHDGFRDYLRLQAQALVNGSDSELHYKADKLWANLADSPLEFTISRESGDELFTGQVAQHPKLAPLLKKYAIVYKRKDLLGVRVGIVDLPSTKDLASYEGHLKALSYLMPFRDTYKQSVDTVSEKDQPKQTLADVDLVYLSGDYAACRPAVTLAQNLPNDDKLSTQLGAGRRNVFHRQFRETYDKETIQKRLDLLVDPTQHHLFDMESDHEMTIGHELTHSLGPEKTKSGLNIDSALGDYGTILEENKADLGGLVSAKYFKDIGKYSSEKYKKILMTWAVLLLPLSNPPLNQHHQVRSIMQLNYFMEHGAIHVSAGGKMSVNFNKMPIVAEQMLSEVIRIQLEGDMPAAQVFVEHNRQWNGVLEYVSQIRKTLFPKPFRILHMPLAETILCS